MQKSTQHISTGRAGEDIACQFLRKKGCTILERNVFRKWGELDVVAQNKRTGKIHIVEVKTVSGSNACVEFNPVENLTKSKQGKLERTCILYVKEKQIENWQLDAVLVWYDKVHKKAEVRYIEHIIN